MYQWIWSILLLLLAVAVFYAVTMNIRFRSYGIPQPLELPFIGFFGLGFMTRTHMSVVFRKAYDMSVKAKYMGAHIFTTPIILIHDLDLIKSVLVKNFENFAYHKTFVDESADPLFAKNLVFANGERWRNIRTMLSPSFTSSKMRSMFVLMSRCAQDFVDQFIELYQSKPEINMKDALTRYANDVIATCAFGLEVNSLREPNNQFYLTGRRATNFASLSLLLKFMLMRLCPSLASALKIRIVSKKDTDFLVNVIQSTIKDRDAKGISRPDMLQLMMDARGKTSECLDMNILEMTAQAFVFFLGGFETTSTNMCLLAHELAVNPEIQKKVQDEIDQVMERCKGELTYEVVNNMEYLDAVISETLRMHPALTALSRICNKEFELPPALPGSKPYLVKPGMEIMVPGSTIQRNPEYYENPDRFNPDRFLGKKAANSDVTTLSFGLGPRMCIGNRFAILETKILFVYLLSRCSIEPSEKSSVPLVYDPTVFGASAKGGFWLRIKVRK
ncbi:cytochrome P450 9AH2 [Nasonia vitripennis]|uniref:Cytochrome P450 n=1 Tax=Nasonia vitripennis TaxID=7425 RepID=A0A7M6UDM6_NASVI|nr:cytochrome P450 9AH2 [Nasonia vitripennis]